MPQCVECGTTFPFRVRVGGVLKNLHGRKRCLDCLPFGKRWQTPVPCNKACPRCGEVKGADAYYASAPSWCRDCHKAYVLERKRRLKIQAVRYKGGCCEDCGRAGHPAGMQFHHPDPSQKDYTISKAKSQSFEKARPELDKCLLLCAYCHAVRHAGDGWKALLEEHMPT